MELSCGGTDAAAWKRRADREGRRERTTEGPPKPIQKRRQAQPRTMYRACRGGGPDGGPRPGGRAMEGADSMRHGGRRRRPQGGPPDGPPVLRVLRQPMGPVSYNAGIIGHGRADPTPPPQPRPAKHNGLCFAGSLSFNAAARRAASMFYRPQVKPERVLRFGNRLDEP